MKESYKHHSLALIAYTLTAIFVLRSYLFNCGLIEYGDTRFHMNLSTQVELFSTTWNRYDGYGFFRIIRWPIFAVLSMFGSSFVAQRVLYFTLMTIIQFNAYVAVTMLAGSVRDEKAKFIAALTGGFLYLFNPWVVAKIGQWFVFWCYAFIPLLFVTLVRSIDSTKKPADILISSATLALILFMGSIDYHYVVFNMVFVVTFTLLYNLLKVLHEKLSWYCSLVSLKRSIIIVVLTSVLYALLEAYWLVPYITEYRITREHWEPFFTPGWVFYRSPSLIDSFRLIDPVVEKLYFPWRGLPWILTTTLMPILAFYAFLRITLRREKYCNVLNCTLVETLTVLALVLIFVGKGARPPFGELYLWLIFHSFLAPFLSWMLRVPYRLACYLAFAYTYLLSILVLIICLDFHEVHAKWKANKKYRFVLPQIVATLLPIIILVNALVASYPALNNFSGVVLPVNPPRYYDYTNEYISADYNGSTNYFRVMWLPSTEYPFYLDVNWSPHPNLTPNPRIWVSDVPVYEYGASPYYYVMYFFIKNTLEKQTFNEIGSILSLLNVRYLVYLQDTTNPQKYANLLHGIMTQEDLRLDKKIQELLIYRNTRETSYIYYADTLVLVLGPLDSLPILIKAGLDPQKTPILFLEQEQPSLDLLEKILDNTKTILVICEPKELSKLALDVYEPAYEFSGFSVGYRDLDGWGKHFLNCPHWIPHFMEGLHSDVPGWRYDFTLGKGILVTTLENATIRRTFALSKSGDYTVWLRVLRSPLSGRLEVWVDGEKVAVLDNWAPWLQGFSWVKAATLRLNAGVHVIELRNLDENLQAVNIVKIVDNSGYETFKNKFIDTIESKVYDTVYVAPTLNGGFAVFREKDKMILFNSTTQLGNFTALGLRRVGHIGRLTEPQLDLVSVNGSQVLRISVTENGNYERWAVYLWLGRAMNVSGYDYLCILFYGTGAGKRFYIRMHSPNGFYTAMFSDDRRGWQRLIIPIDSMEPNGKPVLDSIIGVEIAPYGCNVSGVWMVADMGLLKGYDFNSVNTFVNVERADYVRTSGTRIVVKGYNGSGRILVFSEAYDGRWKVYGRGVAYLVFPINFVEQGAIVTSDCKEVVIEYAPEKMFNFGKRLTLFTVTLMVILVVLSKLERGHICRKKVLLKCGYEA